MAEPLLTLRQIGFARQGRDILRQVDVHVQAGEIVTLIGPNGAGKSCVVKIAVGLLQPDQGTRQLKAGVRIGYLPQKLKLDASLPLRVADFLTLLPKKPTTKALHDALVEVGAEHLLQQSVHALSGGEWQRVLLARALLQRPELLVLDEPMQGVDLTGQEELYSLLAELPKRHGCGILLVSHDLHLVMAATDRVLCLNGHICCAGHPEAVSTHPEYLRLFGWQGSRGLAVYSHHHDHRHDMHGCIHHDHLKQD